MTADETGGPDILSQARERCTRLVDDLRRDAAEFQRPSPHVSAEALAEGRAACDRTVAAADELLRRLNDSTNDPTPEPK